MADKTINELVEATQILQQDLFVLQQENTAKKLSGQTLVTYLLRMIDGHGGVRNYEKVSTSGFVDTYRFTFADESTLDIPVTNGRAITSVNETSVSGLTRTYTIAFNDNTSQAFTVTDGRSITEIKKTRTDVLSDTYTISYNDGTTSPFVVMNGRGIQLFEKASTSGLKHTYRFSYNDGTSNEFTVTDGEKGDKGDNTYTHFKFASQEPTDTSHSIGDIPDNWLGMYWGPLKNAPTDWKQYQWFKIKGENGDTGDPATLISFAVAYQISDSGVITPSGTWSSSVPVVPQGKYLWTRTTITFNSGRPVVSYSVSRMGLDGSGSVTSVANISPDENGNVPLTASDVGALPNTGGDMTGELRMNGQPISGLNAPTANDQAANMGFVNQQVKKAVHRDLLDNSDFTNPVNQRGFTSDTVSGARYQYVLDRWIGYPEVDGGSVEIIDGVGVALTNATLTQYVPAERMSANKQYTLVLRYADGRIDINTNPWIVHDADCSKVVLYMMTGTLINAALYEGEYTQDTIPDYQPKGYGVELVECRRYYRKYNTRKQGVFFYHNAIMVFGLDKTPMRETPSTVNVESITDIGGNVDFKDTIVRYEKDENGLVFITLNMSRDVNSWVYVTGIEESAEIL